MNSTELNKGADESYYQYLWRLDNLIRAGKYQNWEAITPTVNANLYDDKAMHKGESAYRKAVKYARDFYEAGVFSSATDDLIRLKDEIRKEKQKLSDERTALNRLSRIPGRHEEDLLHLKELISDNGKLIFSPKYDYIPCHSDNDMLVCLSDFHLGLDVDNHFGRYNAEVAEDRLNQYLLSIKNLKELHESENCYLVLLGDLISGNIHVTTRLENRENVTEQVQKCGELLSAFTYELSKIFNHVYVSSTSGNHSRIGKKDEVCRAERLDSLIPWYIEAKVSHLNNIEFIKDNYDSTIGRIEIRGQEYLTVHGDFDSFSREGISKLVMMIGHKPRALIVGHHHRNSYDEVSDIQLIRSGAFCGTGDDHCISKRIYGEPGQMICICDNTGVVSLYPIKLTK